MVIVGLAAVHVADGQHCNTGDCWNSVKLAPGDAETVKRLALVQCGNTAVNL